MLLLFIGCVTEPPGRVGLLAGFDFGWRAFNHRVSALELGGDGVGVVGGTSTTGVSPELGDSCDPDACQEFPFVDTADIGVRTLTVEADGLQAREGSIPLVTGAEGARGVLALGEGMPEGWEPALAGLHLQTTVPEGCYDPAFGWLPTELSVEVVRDGGDAVVTAAFAAGLSLEAERACLDAVASEASITLVVDVVAVGGPDTATATVEQSAAWGEVDGEWEAQEPPAAVPVDLPAARAWQALSWSFHADDPEGRGAYLRTLGFDADGRGWATNASPGTQLSGFSYAFQGRLVGFDADATSTSATAAYTPSLDAAGHAEVVQLQ
jgi:hypothetical protein